MSWRGRSIAAMSGVPVLAATLFVAVPHLGGSVPATLGTAGSGGPTFPGTSCPAFPADNVWNTPITGLPVNRMSSTWLAAMDATGPNAVNLHPDFGPPPSAHYGIPWEIVPSGQRFVHVSFGYASQSNDVLYPFGSNTPIEGGQHATGDRHALMVDPATCTLYELWDAYYKPDGKSTAGSGAVWDLRSNKLRPAGWTSADAAGLPILPGLVNYDEVKSGHIDHALRFTTSVTAPAYIWPARHQAGSGDGDDPPMGARFRLEASFELPASECNAMCQTVVTAMKSYGLILADNGSDWFFQGTDDPRWALAEASTMVEQLKQIPSSAFQAVDESCLQVSANSGQALQPGTPAYVKACG